MFSKKYLSKNLRHGLAKQPRGISPHFNQQMASLFTSSKALSKPAGTQESFANGTSSVYMEQMYDQWKRDPNSVHASWRSYFSNIDNGVAQPFELPPTVGSDSQVQQVLTLLQQGYTQGPRTTGALSSDATKQLSESYKLMLLIRAFMSHGHMNADLDPLKLEETYKEFDTFAEKFKIPRAEMRALLDYRSYGFTEEDLEREFYIDAPELAGLLSRKKHWKLSELMQAYKNAYCQKIGVEYMHIPFRDQCNWIRDRFESFQYQTVPHEKQIQNFERLVWATSFGTFLENKFNTYKRFGLEGCESFIPGLKVAIDTLVDRGAEKVIIGMPHRGRLNVLANVVRKPLEQIFSEFAGKTPAQMDQVEDWTNSGDVKYHLGTTYEKKLPNGKTLHVTLLANPSHLEAINPVVMGRARAEQHFLKDDKRIKVVPIIIHGDAAFAGQGVVYESLQMQNLQGYTVGGSIHVIVNNQIGFTTTPNKSRSGVYCSDLAKAINAPIFHVNADSMDDVAKTFKIAAKYRQKYGTDVVIDLIGYRKYGHNELDQPAFTQPLMYKKIKQMKSVDQIYEKELIDKKVITQEEAKAIRDQTLKQLEDSYAASKSHEFKLEEWQTIEWEEIKKPEKFGKVKDTGVPLATLKDIGEKITTLPDDWDFHPQIKKIYEQRRKSIQEGKSIDMGTAEALAFATLIHEGFHVRLSGQDVERGTFSHRHAAVFHQSRDGSYIPINSIRPNQERRQFIVSNSHLSEFAVLGYEYGYDQTSPNTLTIWEAQFGDFANGAQVIIDTMLCSGEAKWNVKNGLVLNLPHGYDGQGPEHSNARLERFLSLCDEDDTIPREDDPNSKRMERVNMQVVYCTTTANYFHVLRRQLRRPFRKPLIMMASKKLLRLKEANSHIEEFQEGLRFQTIITDVNKDQVADDKLKRVILCAGQVYYDLEAARVADKRNDIAIIRVEQLCPFPFRRILAEVEKYKNAEVMWCQEEHQNMGAWSYASPRLHNILKYLKRKETEPLYAGREPSAASSTGYAKVHEQELKALLKVAMA